MIAIMSEPDQLTFEAFMISCRARSAVRDATLRSLAAGGWKEPVHVVMDDEIGATPIARIHRTWRRVIERAASSEASAVLLLEDDLVAGRWFRDNLGAWPLWRQLAPGQAFFASLYHPSLAYHVARPADRYLVAHAPSVWGAQALLMPPTLARYIDQHWDEEAGHPDMRMPRLAARVTPIYFHLPSLVDHADVPTTWGGVVHRAVDFDFEWRHDAVTAVDPATTPPPAHPSPGR
jgi:hypothetical protein